MENRKAYRQNLKEETIIEVLLRFLRREDAGAPAPLVSKRGILESYGVPIAIWDDGRIVMAELNSDQLIPVRMKHRKWLEVMAQERNVSVGYEQE